MQPARYRGFSYTFRAHDIPHYYGDYVRAVFLAVAVLLLVAAAAVGPLLPFGVLAQASGAIFLVLLAGLTNPHSRMIMIYNVLVSALGVLLFQSAALTLYSGDSLIAFCVREAVALASLFAFYFSVKTLRAMTYNKVGKAEQPWEFEDSNDKPE